jgi:hypothetical protein
LSRRRGTQQRSDRDLGSFVRQRWGRDERSASTTRKIRSAVNCSGLPVDQVTRVSILDPTSIISPNGALVTTGRPRSLGVDCVAAPRFVQHARNGVRWFAAWASVVLVSSALACGFDLALTNCCSSDGPLRAASPTQPVAESAPKDDWHSGALSLSPPDRSAANRESDDGGCWPFEARGRACRGFWN